MNIDGTGNACEFNEIPPVRGTTHLSVRGGGGQIVLQNSDPGDPASGLYTLNYDWTSEFFDFSLTFSLQPESPSAILSPIKP